MHLYVHLICTAIMLQYTQGRSSRQILMDDPDDNNIPTDAPVVEDTLSEDQLQFRLFSKQGPEHDVPISATNSSEYLKQIFQKNLPTKFIVHGWLGSVESTIVRTTGEVYLTEGDYNIVGVDWSNMASWKLYPVSTYSVLSVGNAVAEMVDRLIESDAITLDNLHLIGHSLGAHVMGIAGSTIKTGRPPRITGLDPANPGYEYIAYDNNRLDPSDAHFVDVIHTSAGVAGFYGPLGHVDFYPNGGTPPQPGCAELRNPKKLFGCSHGRSYEYFTESIINPKGFRSVECDSWSSFSSGLCDNHTVEYMGAYVSNKATGVFYLATNAEPPYAQG